MNYEENVKLASWDKMNTYYKQKRKSNNHSVSAHTQHIIETDVQNYGSRRKYILKQKESSQQIICCCNIDLISKSAKYENILTEIITRLPGFPRLFYA